jgi:hypothetical protein
LALTDSRELSGWQALYLVEADEAQRRKDLIEGDGEVIEHGVNPDAEMDEDGHEDDGD